MVLATENKPNRRNPLTEMTFEQQLEAKIALAQANHQERVSQSLAARLDNPAFIEMQRHLKAKHAELAKLQTMIRQLNSIKPFITNDGSKYTVNVYPVQTFESGLAEVVGIIAGSRSAFTDELALEYEAITGLSMLELTEARVALGQPSYVQRDGEIVSSVNYDYDYLMPLLDSIMLKLGLTEITANSMTVQRLRGWFEREEKRAIIRQKAMLDTAALDAESDFTMEG